MRRLHILIVATFCGCGAALVATLAAYAGGPTRIDGWLLPRDLSQNDDYTAQGPGMVMDSDGRLHVMWVDNRLGQPDAHYVRSLDQGTSWLDAERILTSEPSYQSSLAVGGGGYVHACWWDDLGGTPRQFRLMYARRSSANWSSAQTVVITDSHVQDPAIAVGGGYLHLLWSNKRPAQAFDLWYSRKPTSGGSWSPPVVVVDTGPASWYAKMVADGDGNLHAVWQEHETFDEIMYITGTVGTAETTWHAPVTLTQALTPSATSPDIQLTDDGTVHVVFALDVPGQVHTQDVYHVSFPSNDTSGLSPTLIPDSRVHITQQLPTYASPALALDPADNNILQLVWNGKGPDDLWDRIYYATSQDGGASWSRVVPISADDAWPDGFPDISAYDGLAHVVWQRETSGVDNDIYYSHSLPSVTGFVLVMKDYQ